MVLEKPPHWQQQEQRERGELRGVVSFVVQRMTEEVFRDLLELLDTATAKQPELKELDKPAPPRLSAAEQGGAEGEDMDDAEQGESEDEEDMDDEEDDIMLMATAGDRREWR